MGIPDPNEMESCLYTDASPRFPPLHVWIQPTIRGAVFNAQRIPLVEFNWLTPVNTRSCEFGQALVGFVQRLHYSRA